MTTLSPIRVEDDQVVLLEQAARMMSEALDHSRAATITLVEQAADSDEVRLDVPPTTLRLLSQLLSVIARQRSFVLFPDDTQLTTNQAAKTLGVSRPFVCKLLDEESIPSTMVGRHRRVRLKDLIEYKNQMRNSRKTAMTRLVEASEEAGLYDL